MHLGFKSQASSKIFVDNELFAVGDSTSTSSEQNIGYYKRIIVDSSKRIVMEIAPYKVNYLSFTVQAYRRIGSNT